MFLLTRAFLITTIYICITRLKSLSIKYFIFIRNQTFVDMKGTTNNLLNKA